jgi:hypothetical protein
MSDKAKRQEVSIGTIPIEGFQMPDGSYQMSLTSAATAIKLKVQNASDFLRSKAAERLLGKGYTPQKNEIEVEPTGPGRGQTRITALPLRVVSAYWLWQTSRGNKDALALVNALLEESLERRFDAAFGVERSEAERQTRLTEIMDVSREEFEALAEAMAEPDLLRAENELLKQQLKDAGIDPWTLPQEPN